MSKTRLLHAPGWSESNRLRLEETIQSGAGQGLPVVFDFDNTIVSGDIGEATLAWLVRENILTPADIPNILAPPLCLPDGRKLTLDSAVDLTEYYEALLAPTVHGLKDPAPFGNGYVWAVEVMQGLRLTEVVQATRQVMACSKGKPGVRLEVTAGKTSYPIPWFYPEIVELIAALIRHRYDLWIVSASNVWSVRWMVLHGLNPLLRSLGVKQGIPLHQVQGVSTLLRDRGGQFHKDAVLVKNDRDYASLQTPVLKSYSLTPFLQFPVPTYSGKVGVIWDYLGCAPYLCAGDSPGDHAMLSLSQYRLWIARLEKTDYQQTTRALIRQTGETGWIIQPALSRPSPGFVSDTSSLPQRLPPIPATVRKSLRLWKDFAESRPVS